MAKVKVTETTWTVWSQETKQTNVELEDGRKLEVRQMEDDNGVETYYRLLGEGDWISSTHYNHQFEDKELEKIVNTIAYNSFNRYKFECWDIDKNCHQITSKYSYPQYTNITITFDKSNRTLRMYQDGQLIEEQNIRRSFLDTKKAWFYLGLGDDRENDRKSFRGFINEFAYWNKPLQRNEIQEIHQSQGFSLLNSYEQYNSSKNLKIYYDFKHIKLEDDYKYDTGKVLNLATNEYDSTSYHSIPKTIQDIQSKTISIPARRQSEFEMIEHKSEGYFEGGWKSKSTRLNQLRFYNEILNNETNLDSDGLSTLKYTKVSDTSQEKYSFISVEL